MNPKRSESRGLSERRSLLWFVGVAFGISYCGQFLIWTGGGIEGPLFGPIAALLMFAPALAAWVAVRAEKGSFRSLLRARLRVFPLVVSILLPVATAIGASFLIAWWLGGHPAPWAAGTGGLLVPSDSPLLWSGEQTAMQLLGNTVLTALSLSVLGGLLALGEEIGWRGYLQPRLVRRLGMLSGLTAVGVLWALWHLPLLLMGYVFPESPVLGGFVFFPLAGVGLSFFLGWLRETTGGILAPTLAHGCYNAFFGTMVFAMEFGGRAKAAYLIIVLLTLVTGFLFLPFLIHRAPGSSPESSGGPPKDKELWRGEE